MMKTYLIFCLCLIGLNGLSFAQDTTYRYEERGIRYKRIAQKQNAGWQVKDYYDVSGALYMKGYFNSLEKNQREGIFEYFYEDNTPSRSLLYRADKLYYIQVWNRQGTPLLINGTGVQPFITNENKDGEVVFKDSLLLYSYFYNTPDERIYYQATVNAEPQGGYKAFYEYIAQKINYPTQARRSGVQGVVYVKFIVNPDGSISDISIEKGIGAGCDEEVIRIVKSSPTWIPGEAEGKKIKQQQTLPVAFKLG